MEPTIELVGLAARGAPAPTRTAHVRHHAGGTHHALAERMKTTRPSIDLVRVLTGISGAQLLWAGLRAAKLPQLVALGLGTYLVIRALAPSRAGPAPRTTATMGEDPAPDVAADPVDTASWGSFPASDPPSHLPRPATS